MRKKLPPLHPGEVLREEFLAPLGLSGIRQANQSAARHQAILLRPLPGNRLSRTRLNSTEN
jgi:hypothetical protein